MRQGKDPIVAPATQTQLSLPSFLIASTALVALIFLAYAQTLNFQFILDDHRFITDPRVQSSGHVWEYFSNYVWSQFAGGPSSFYRPLFVLWMRLNFVLNEMSPWGWHLLSVLKHIGVATLLGLLVWTLLRDRIAALMAAGLFALHPAQTESVAWVTVPDPLMSIAVLGSVLLFLKYTCNTSGWDQPRLARTSGSLRKKKRAAVTQPSASWLLGSATAYLAALLVKETAIIVLPIVFALAVLLPDWKTPQNPNATTAASCKIRMFHAFRLSIPFLVVTPAYVALRWHALQGNLVAGTQHLRATTILLSLPATLWFYVKVLFWAVRLRAFADSSQTDKFSVNSVLLPGLGIVLVAVIMAVIVWWAWTRSGHEPSSPNSTRIRGSLLLGVLLLVLPVLPALNLNALNPGDFLHGRYMYLPIAGLMFILATVWHVAPKGRVCMLAAFGLLAIAFTALTVRQETAWKDDLTVFTMAHEIAPHNAPVALSLARARVQMAFGLDESGQCNDALPIFRDVTRQYPDDWFAWAGLGDCYVQLEDLPRAEQALHRAADLSRNPRVVQQWEQVRARVSGPMPSSSSR